MLRVKLPGVEKSLQRRSQRLLSDKATDKKQKSSAERVAKFRKNIRNDPQRLLESQRKKRDENMRYKNKIKDLRTKDNNLDDKHKMAQRMWKQKSRRKEQLRKKVTEQRTEEANKERNRKEREARQEKRDHDRTQQKWSDIYTEEPQSKSRSLSSPRTRKRAERCREKLPSTPDGWSKTMTHLIRNATPTRSGALLNSILCDDPTMTSGVKQLAETIELNKVGKPKKEYATVKKQLSFCDNAALVYKNKKNIARYQSRKKRELKRLHTKPQLYRIQWKDKVHDFLNENSRVMPNKKDTVLIDGHPVAKRHLLMTKYQAYKSFKLSHPDFTRKFTTFKKMIPCNICILNQACRRVCICTKDYNIEQQVNAINKVATALNMSQLKTTARNLSEETLCNFNSIPSLACIERSCSNCGTDRILKKYQPLITSAENTDNANLKASYHQWEKHNSTYTDKHGTTKRTERWIQIQKSTGIASLVSEIAEAMKSHSGHIFRADFQHNRESDIMKALPQNHCIAVFDFSENITLVPQDEIESAHWTQQQVTLHPIFVVRHALESTEENPVIIKESLIILSDHLAHDASTVYVFTQQLFTHLRNNAGQIDVLHRFSDNCAVQYKCIQAFGHLPALEKENDVKIIYHYTESGHGKGPSDGLGASTKKKLDRLILGGKVVTNAYQAYLALAQNEASVQKKNPDSCQRMLYIPSKVIQRYAPKKLPLKTLKGTQKFHMIQTVCRGGKVVRCDYLSCSCDVCLGLVMGPCYFGQYRGRTLMLNMETGKQVTTQDMVTPSDSQDANSVDTSICGGGEQDLRRAEAQSLQASEDHETQVATHMSIFDQDIAPKGWHVRGHTPSDGNCMFWAASDQLENLSARNYTHKTLRNMTVAYLKALPQNEQEDLEHFLVDHDNLQEYIAYLERSGSYADQMAVNAMSSALKCQVCIVTPDGQDIKIGSDGPQLVLGFIPRILHYVSLEQLHRTPQADDFVAVWLHSSADSRKSYKRLFLAKVMQVDGSEGQQNLRLKYLKPHVPVEKCVYTWSTDNDWSWQSPDNIARVLTQPTLLPGRGIHFQFLSDEINGLKMD